MYEEDDIDDDFLGCDCNGKCEFCLATHLPPNCTDYYASDFSSDLPSSYFESLDLLLPELLKKSVISDLSLYPNIPLREKDYKHGLLYVVWDTLTPEKLNNKICYEGNGWYPIEIVKEYYKTYGINPFVKSYAYARETFNVDFTGFTNEQFRSFIGKCTSKSYDEVWRTKDYQEFMRARYILRDRITSFNFQDGVYQITYKSDKKPWNMPVVSVYVKAHQKYNLFKQYNKLIDNNIIPVAVSVDGIEVKEKCDELFDLGAQWKKESVYINGSTEPSVIQREIAEVNSNLIPFDPELILPKYLHVSGAGGNGKSEYIIQLAKAYPYMMFLAPTNDAVKNLVDRAKALNITIQADTYHKVFGFGCRDEFPRNKYTRFVLDECSMLSADNLNIIMNKMNKNQSLLIAGDFWQLPCIQPDTPIYDNWTGEMSAEYKRFEIKELTTNWRQKTDSEFFELCNRLRGKLSKEEAMKILAILNVRSNKVIPAHDSLDDIYICGINNQVDVINSKYTLSVGCKIICNMTCHDIEGTTVPNSSIGMVESMTPFKIRWADGSISTFKGVGQTKSKKPRFTPAYALTIHKAQGKTLKRHVIINPSRLFAKNHLYVALTRATSFSNVFFTEKMTYDVFSKTVLVDDEMVAQRNFVARGTSSETLSPRGDIRKTIHPSITHRPRTTRLERMLNTYVSEEPRLTLQFLEAMKLQQKNMCCYCEVSMCDLHGEPHSITLERIDDSKRHILENIKMACSSCNSSHRKS
jgi:hypothetical protein